MRSEDWRPIESAPKNGAVLLLNDPEDGMRFGYWVKDKTYRDGGFWKDRDRQHLRLIPTHWQPIEPPALKGPQHSKSEMLE